MKVLKMYKPICGVPVATGGLPNGLEAVSLIMGRMIVRSWPYDPHDAESKDAALRAFDDYGFALRNKIETNLGRRLTEKELHEGLQHVEDEDEYTRARVKQECDAVFAPPPDPRNWAEKMLDEHKAEQARQRDPKGAFLKESVEKLAAQEAEEERRAALAASPRRQKVVAHATTEKLAALYDPSLPASEVRAADHRLRLAKEGNLRTYTKEANDFYARQEQRLQEQAKPVAETFQVWGQRLKQAKTRFELPAADIVEAGRDPYATTEERNLASSLRQQQGD